MKFFHSKIIECTKIQIRKIQTPTIQILKKKLKGPQLKKYYIFEENKNLYVGIIIIYKAIFSFCKILNIFLIWLK